VKQDVRGLAGERGGGKFVNFFGVVEASSRGVRFCGFVRRGGGGGKLKTGVIFCLVSESGEGRL